MSSTSFPIVTISGSLRFWDHMLTAAQKFTADGWIVLMPFVADYIGGQAVDDKKLMLDDMHFTKISMSNLVYVVNSCEYIGESTANEIAYALDKQIKVEYMVKPC
jgi:hypothetical protein